MSVPEIAAKGLFLIGDPHLADTPPGQRLPGYREQVMDKIAACLERAKALGMLPVFLGDLFHWPRENSNAMLVNLIDLLGPHGGELMPYVLVGNHDKYQARLTRDVSLAVLEAAGVVRLMSEPGPQLVLRVKDRTALVGASPDGTSIPSLFHRDDPGPDFVLWLTHHNIQFPEFQERAGRIREIPGVDWVINGHIHRPQPTLRAGSTIWANPGNITRLTFTRRSKERKPSAAIWTPGLAELEKWVVPHLAFEQVFPDQEFPPEEQETEGESGFILGLERLAWRRTREGMGLEQFLKANLNPELLETELIWDLYREVTSGGQG
ncbi:MAG: metallophosphoesterase [Desulfovibrionaceae bacterium]|nr:metallophosphoesterase [Desulfovibrionaceae bacterium]